MSTSTTEAVWYAGKTLGNQRLALVPGFLLCNHKKVKDTQCPYTKMRELDLVPAQGEAESPEKFLQTTYAQAFPLPCRQSPNQLTA